MTQPIHVCPGCKHEAIVCGVGLVTEFGPQTYSQVQCGQSTTGCGYKGPYGHDPDHAVRLHNLLCRPVSAPAAEILQHVHINAKQAIITGDPQEFPDSVADDDPRRHNCDAMGCPTLDHILYRLPYTDHRKLVDGKDVKALAKMLAESIDFTAGPVQARELFEKKLAAAPLPEKE